MTLRNFARSLALASFVVVIGIRTAAVAADRSLWSEFIPLEQVRAHAAELVRRESRLHYVVREVEWVHAEFYETWSALLAEGVELRAWLLLKREDGYWP